MKTLTAFVALLVTAGAVSGLPDYTGYSGAPGSGGTCAAWCHGSGGGSLTVSGFPSTYVAGQAYTITVGGSGMSNFNASVRIGTGSEIAGTLTAGTNTEVYSVTGETQGVHLSQANRDNGTFIWTAPSPGVGAVKLYFAGHQSGYDGPNTETVLTAQGSGVEEPGNGSGARPYLRVEPSVVTTRLVVRLGRLPEPGLLRLFSSDGRLLLRRGVPAAVEQALMLPVQDESGNDLAAGTYQVLVTSGEERLLSQFSVR